MCLQSKAKVRPQKAVRPIHDTQREAPLTLANRNSILPKHAAKLRLQHGIMEKTNKCAYNSICQWFWIISRINHLQMDEITKRKK